MIASDDGQNTRLNKWNGAQCAHQMCVCCYSYFSSSVACMNKKMKQKFHIIKKNETHLHRLQRLFCEILNE